MQALAGFLPSTCSHAPMAQPIPGRRLCMANFRNGSHSLKRCAQPAKARKELLTLRTQCAAAPTAAASSPSGNQSRSGFNVSVSVDEQPKSHLELTVSVPQPMVKRAYNGTLKNFRKSTNIPGFRSGDKVPDTVLFRYAEGGHNGIKKAAVERLLQISLPEALKPYKGVAIHDSLVIDSPVDDLVAAMDLQSPLQYKIGIDLAPKVAFSSSYRDIQVEVDAASNDEADRAAVERMLQSLRKESGTLRVVSGRGVQQGDVVIAAFNCMRADTGEAILGAKKDGMRLDTDTADREFIPGLVGGMAGMAVGEERSIPVTFPPNWEPEQLRGVQANCSVKVSEIFEWELPELTDEFISQKIPRCSSLADAQQQLFEAQQLQATEATQNALVGALTEAVADIVEADIPDSLMRSLGEQEYQSELLKMQMEQKVNVQVVQQLATQEMLTSFIDHKRDKLDRMNRAILAFEEIYRAEGLNASQEEVAREFEKAAKDFREAGAEFDETRLKEQATETVRAHKVLEWLQQNTSITVKPHVESSAA